MPPEPAVDTIAAIATAQGRASVGVVRLSGPASAAIARRLTGQPLSPRKASLATVRSAQGEALDQGLVLYFPAPHSYTGEDVVEFQGHGGPVVMDAVLHSFLACGARLAAPGEFTRRAFLNGKIDLTRAEAIADLIDSQSQRAAQLAMRTLQGALAQQVEGLAQRLVQLRVRVEATLDFPDEDVDPLADRVAQDALAETVNLLRRLAASAEQGRILREGCTVVISGRPNAGKSTLLNALSGRDSAIVTDIPGTTRDLIREHIQIDGLPVHLIDTAGLRDTTEAVERIGIERALAEITNADLILYLIDDTVGWNDMDQRILDRLPAGVPLLRVFTKSDLSGRRAGASGEDFRLSATADRGLNELRQLIKQRLGGLSSGEGLFLARRRHVQALQAAEQHLLAAQAHGSQGAGVELLAEELRLAHKALGTITGEFTSDDLLGEIFASFCIGK